MYTRKPLPTSQYELSKGVENKAFGRSNDIRRDDDKFKDLTIGLFDLDHCIKWYFDNVIKPKVNDFGRNLDVPVMYGAPEKWKNMQADGYFRDENGKIQAPLISYRRTAVTKNRLLGNKVDANYPALYRTQEIKYTQQNRYDQFTTLTNIKPVRNFINTIIPEYVDITYEVVVWTDFIEHMNSIVESIVYSEGSYWGEPDRFKFRTKIDDFQNTTDLQVETDRIVRTNFTITLFGYLVPDVLVKNLSKHKSNKTNSVQQLNVEFNADADKTTFQDKTTVASGTSLQTTSPIPQTNVLQPTISVSTLTITYLNTNTTKQATTVTAPNTATFTSAAFLVAPAGLPVTSVSSFQFFVNGQYVEPGAITSFVDNGDGSCTLTVNVAELGFTLVGTDEIVAIGKFA
jgi:hypothetical protein